MQTIYRLTKARHQDTALAGEGAMRYAGRWHRQGTRIIYASDSPAGSLLEVMVHTEAARLFDDTYAMFDICFDPDVHLLTVEPEVLPDDWRAVPWPATTQEIGSLWATRDMSVVLEVPSAVIPRQCNYLINVRHPAFDELDISGPEPFDIDPRLA